MKICFLTNNIFNLGGVQRVISVLASELSKDNQVDILCTSPEVKIDRKLYGLSGEVTVKFAQLDKKNFFVRVYTGVGKRINNKFNKINNIDIITELYYPRSVRKKYTRYLNNHDYDIVIGAEANYSLLLSIIKDKIKSKVIGWQHNSYDAYFKTPNKYYWKQNEMFKKYLNKLDYCVVLTEDDKEKFIKHFKCTCKTIYNPLSFNSINKSECTSNNILFVGRLVKEQKGLDLLIRTFKIVFLKEKNWNLNIVGDGIDKEWLVNKIKEEGLNDNIKIIGSSNNVKKYYLESSIFVSTSRWEGFGLVITEAMECGLPVVTFNNSGPVEIINKNNVNGILVERENCELLAKNILYLINDYTNRIRMSREAIKRAEDFKIENILKQWNKIIK